jgi:hypothetical protein
MKNVMLFSLIFKSETSTKCDVNPNVEVLLEPKKESQKRVPTTIGHAWPRIDGSTFVD